MPVATEVISSGRSPVCLLAGLGANLGNPDDLRAHLHDPALQDNLKQAANKAATFFLRTVTAGFAAMGTIFGCAFAACTAGALIFYFSMAMPRIHAAIHRSEATKPDRAEAIRTAMGRVGGYLTGQALVSLGAGATSYLFS